MFVKIKIIALAALALLCASCTAHKVDMSLDFEAPFQVAEAPSGPQAGVLGVDEFVDLRGRGVTSSSWLWLGLVPGVLWIETESDVPDVSLSYTNYTPGPFARALPKALGRSIANTPFFERVVYLPTDRYVSVDYRLEGEIHKMGVRETGYYYGFFAYVWLTRLLGLPYVSYEIEMDVTLRLREMKGGTVLWEGQLMGVRTDRMNNIYSIAGGRQGKDVISHNFASMLSEQMPEALMGMARAISGL